MVRNVALVQSGSVVHIRNEIVIIRSSSIVCTDRLSGNLRRWSGL